jgi:small-conductance mechanosensitive channel
MDAVAPVLDILRNFLPLLTTIAVVSALLLLFNFVLRRRWKGRADAQFRFQLIMLALTFAGLLAVLIALPIDDDLRGQLLSLIGILLTAAIALASTTFIGNIMAGVMLKVVGSARPGDFITVADLTGRITEMALLHTEIQTEFRDLVTVPNLYLVTQPVQVVRASGTILSSEVSLGYDVQHQDACDTLKAAAEMAGLKDPFVHVRELGDFSVSYRVAGLLEDVQSLISARSQLRRCMLDALHDAGIEIVSPNFMNTRTLAPDQRFMAEPTRRRPGADEASAEQLAFDKAQEAAEIESIRKAINAIDERVNELDEEKSPESAAELEALARQKDDLAAQLEVAEAKAREGESADA